MKNKGFSLVEILAVIVIIGILGTMVTIGVTRIARNAYERDLGNLHSSLETTFDNYRTELISSGDTHLSEISIDNNLPMEFNNYITGLSFRGRHLNRTVLFGSTIKLYTKGDILKNENYSNDIAANIDNFDSLTKDEQFILLQEQYIIDSTCIAQSTASNAGQSSETPKNHCKMENESPVPSQDEIKCLKVIYNGETVIDDYGMTPNALVFTPLCKYLSE